MQGTPTPPHSRHLKNDCIDVRLAEEHDALHLRYLREKLMFTKYTSLNRDYDRVFGSQQSQFPYAFLILDHLARNELVGNQKVVKRDAIRYSTLTAKVLLARILLILVRILFSKKSKKKSAFVHLQKFPDLAVALKKELNKSGYRVCQELLYRTITTSAIRKNQEVRKLIGCLCHSTVENFCRDAGRLRILDQAVKHELNELVGQLDNLGIQCIITQGDQSPVDRLMCEAAKILGSRHVVIAHGYFTNPALTSVAPIHTELLCVWTDLQKKELAKFLEAKSRQRIKCLGFPFPTYLGRNSEIPRIALFVLPPIRSYMALSECLAPVLKQYFRLLDDMKFQVRVRFHPKQEVHQANQFRSLFKTKIDRFKDVRQSIAKAGIVIGADTSVLVETQCCGGFALQMKEVSRCHLERVPRVTKETLPHFIEKILAGDSEGDLSQAFFDTGKLVRYLDYRAV